MTKEYDGTYEIDVSGYPLSRANAKIVGHVCKLNVCGRTKMSKVKDLALEIVFLTADSRRDITPEVDTLIQAAQDEVWEFIEKVVGDENIMCLELRTKGWRAHYMGRDLNHYSTAKEAILEAAKELEIE